MASTLAASVRVRIGAPPNCAVGESPVPIVEYESERRLRAIVDDSAMALVPRQLFQVFPSLLRATTRLIVDLGERPDGDDRSSPAIRVGDFFVCATEEARESWLRVLVASGRVSRRARRRGDLRRLIDVVAAGLTQPDVQSRAQSTVSEWERLVDPLRLYCTSTSRRPPGWAWSPPTAVSRAVGVLREHGPLEFARRSIACLSGSLAAAHRAGRRLAALAGRAASGRPRATPGAGLSPAALPPGFITGLESAMSMADYGRVLRQHGLANQPRYMDLEVDISNKCNIRCRMCYFSVDSVFSARAMHLSPADFGRIAASILPHARAVMLSLGSEPLTSPYFADLLALTAEYRVPEVGFYTNGLLMTDRVIDAILEHRVTLVAVSVDGATRHTFERIRRGADFGLLLRNVRTLVRRRAATGRGWPRIRFGVVMMRDNVEELPDIVTLAWRLGVQELNFFHAVVYDGLDMSGQSLSEHKELSNRYLALAKARAHELGVTIVHTPSPFELGPRAVPGDPAAKRRDAPYCTFPFVHVSMNSNADVLPCPFSHGEPPYGTVTAGRSFEEIWLGAEFRGLRRRILANDPPAMCRRCSYMASSHPDVAEFFVSRPS
jgi:MoaA/NifB/PqqE/SkfB family radical SAM enzyme